MPTRDEPFDRIFRHLVAKLRLRHLQLLVAISEHGSLQSAAESISLTQPSATQAVKEIEAIIEVRLFDRYSKGVKPTQFGLLLIDYARSTLLGLKRAAESIAALQVNEHPIIRLGAIEAASHLVSSVIPAFHTRHPNVRVLVTEDTGKNLSAQLVSGQVDLALCRSTVVHPPHIMSVAISSDEPVIVCKTDHLLAKKNDVAIADLLPYRWVVAPPGTQMSLVFDDLQAKFGSLKCSPISSMSIDLIIGMVSSDSHIALIPRTLAVRGKTRGLIDILSFDVSTCSSIGLPGIAIAQNRGNAFPLVTALHDAFVDGCCASTKC